MEIAEALYALGVRPYTLTDGEKAQLDCDGFLSMRGMLTMGQVEEFRTRQQELLDEEGDLAGTETHREAGTDRLANLIDKGACFHLVLQQPRVLAAISHVLGGDLKLSSLNSRSALPGQGHQGLHADWGRNATPEVYQVCNSFWLLDPFTAENGATRLVPGSHRLDSAPGNVMADPKEAHPDEIVLLGDPGDIVVVNSHVWHGGTTNRTLLPRRVLHGYFVRRGHPPQNDWDRFLHRSTWDQLPEAARVVLGSSEPAQ